MSVEKDLVRAGGLLRRELHFTSEPKPAALLPRTHLVFFCFLSDRVEAPYISQPGVTPVVILLSQPQVGSAHFSNLFPGLEMALRLRSLAALSEDRGWIPNTQMMAHSHLEVQFRGI